MENNVIARTGRVQSWIDDPTSRLPVSCTVFVVEDSMEGPNGIEASWRFVSHALRFGAGVAVHRHAHGGADHGDVHLRARRHAEVGIAGVRRCVIDLELDNEFAVGQRQLAGTGDHVGNRDGSFAVGASDHGAGLGGDHGGDTVGGG